LGDLTFRNLGVTKTIATQTIKTSETMSMEDNYTATRTNLRVFRLLVEVTEDDNPDDEPLDLMGASMTMIK